eukprot:5827-Heterococcus_DN1.PRE.1
MFQHSFVNRKCLQLKLTSLVEVYFVYLKFKLNFNFKYHRKRRVYSSSNVPQEISDHCKVISKV